jgi:ABC-type nitrate/sulfonate/bicarbonate transport system substrate-binding protein
VEIIDAVMAQGEGGMALRGRWEGAERRSAVKRKLMGLLCVAVLVAAACGGDDEASGGGGDGGFGVERVQLAIDTDDYMNNLAVAVADDRYWSELGFEKSADWVATDEYMAGLFGGDVWMAQGESDAIWAALAEGSVPLKIVGVEKDTEAWFIGIRKGVDPDNLEGLKISGGAIGDRNITVGEKSLEDMGVDPETLEWVPIEGSSDDRLTALIAGQIDVAVLQPRHLIPLDEAGGEMIYQEFVDAPQEVWVTTEDFLAENEEAVCAYLEGRIEAKRWMGEGDDNTANQEAAIEIGRQDPYRLEPAEGDLAEWSTEITDNWALDGGAPADAFEQWNQDMIANENVPEDFDWHDHIDFDCLWQVQEKLGLEQNPAEDEI